MSKFRGLFPVVGVKEAEMAERWTTAKMEAFMEEEIVRAVAALAEVSKLPPEEIERELRLIAARGRDLGRIAAQPKRKKKSPSPEALERARVRMAKKREATVVEKRRLEAELRAARGLLNRIDTIEAIAKRLEAVQGSVMKNARAAVDDANAVLARADTLLGRINGADKWFEAAQEVEVERRVRSHLGAEARELRAAKQEEIKAAKIAVGAALGTVPTTSGRGGSG